MGKDVWKHITVLLDVAVVDPSEIASNDPISRAMDGSIGVPEHPAVNEPLNFLRTHAFHSDFLRNIQCRSGTCSACITVVGGIT